MCHHDLSGFPNNLFGRCHDLYNNRHNFSTCIFFLVGTIVYLYGTAIYLVSAAIYLIGTTLYIIPVLQFNAKDEEGNVSTHDSILSVEPIKHTETYSLRNEHWSIYSYGDDEDKFIPGMSGLMSNCHKNLFLQHQSLLLQ